MITPKIKAIFHFIEFLYSNIENFESYNEIINDLYLLNIERHKLKPTRNFVDKLKYDEVQAKLKDKFKVIQENIIQPIQAKASELNICDLNRTETLWNWNSTEILELKENFSKDDLPEIFSYKKKYLEYRTKTKGEAFFGLGLFFDGLDEILKELFDYFKETDRNEFETFETKTIKVNDWREAVEQIKKGNKKVSLPIELFLNQSKVQHQKVEQWDTFYDEIDWNKYDDEGIAEIRRRYVKGDNFLENYRSEPRLAPIAAKGISAYLSFWSYSRFKSFRLLLYENEKLDLEKNFNDYYQHCYKFMEDEENTKAFKEDKKSEKKLIQMHIDQEEILLNESTLLFEEVKEWEKLNIEIIKKAALNYLEFVKDLLNNINNDSSKTIGENFSDQITYENEARSANKSSGNPSSKRKEIQPLPTKLTTEQRSKLFDLLVEGEFMPNTTNKDYFNWAFGESSTIKPEKYELIKWLKIKNLAVYLIDNLCNDPTVKIQSNYLFIAEKIFGIKSMAQQRNGYKNNEMGAPINANLIDEIIAKVNAEK